MEKVTFVAGNRLLTVCSSMSLVTLVVHAIKDDLQEKVGVIDGQGRVGQWHVATRSLSSNLLGPNSLENAKRCPHHDASVESSLS